MKRFEKKIKVGTKVNLYGTFLENFYKVTEINENRNLIRIEGFEGQFQRKHIKNYSNK